jgi:hypothetical protein
MVSEHLDHPSPDARPPPADDDLRTGLAQRLWLAVMALAGSLSVSAFGALHGLRPAQRLSAVALVIVGATQVVNSIRRLLERHHEIEGMGRKLLVEFVVLAVVPLSIGGCVLAHQPSLPLLAVYALVALASFAIAELLEREIARSLADREKRSITAWSSSLTWPARWFLGEDDTSLGDVFARVGGFVAAAGRVLLDVPSGRIGLVRMGMVATLALAAVGFGEAPLVAIGGAEGSRSSTAADVAGPGARRPGRPRRQGPRQAAPDPSAKTTPSLAPPSALAERWDHRCLTAPGAGAPAAAEWVGRELHELYLGATGTTRVPVGYEAPGALAGCTGKVERVRGARDAYFTIATYPRTGEIGSVAVDSARYRPALFIAPAALPVLALLRRYKVLGGTIRHRVGRGDFYLIEVDIGTIVLVRAQYQEPGHPGVVEGYVQLDPPVAEAWMDCMRERHGWLWPVRRPLPHAGGEIAYDLVDDVVAPRYHVIVSYDPERHIAHRALTTQTRYYLPPGHRLDEGEVVGMAATAR